MDESEAKSQEMDNPETETNSDHSSAVKELLSRTGYKLETFPSSRVYGGPPPDFTGDEPKEECQVLQKMTVLFVLTLSGFSDVLFQTDSYYGK